MGSFMIEIDFNSAVAIYDQVKAGIRGLVARGALRPGDPAPTVRGLALDLKINPNTAARALRELVEEGILETRRGSGCLVAEGAPKLAKDGLSGSRGGLREALRLARRSGMDWAAIEKTVREEKNAERE